MTRRSFLPYGKQYIDQDDIDAVTEVLKSDWLTTGPAVEKFEKKLAGVTRASYAISCSSGTAALHLALLQRDRICHEFCSHGKCGSLCWRGSDLCRC